LIEPFEDQEVLLATFLIATTHFWTQRWPEQIKGTSPRYCKQHCTQYQLTSRNQPSNSAFPTALSFTILQIKRRRDRLGTTDRYSWSDG